MPVGGMERGGAIKVHGPRHVLQIVPVLRPILSIWRAHLGGEPLGPDPEKPRFGPGISRSPTGDEGSKDHAGPLICSQRLLKEIHWDDVVNDSHGSRGETPGSGAGNPCVLRLG